MERQAFYEDLLGYAEPSSLSEENGKTAIAFILAPHPHSLSLVSPGVERFFEGSLVVHACCTVVPKQDDWHPTMSSPLRRNSLNPNSRPQDGLVC